MSMTRIANYIHFARSIDLRREEDRYLKLPDGQVSRTVLMKEKKGATFSTICAKQLAHSALTF